MLRYAVLCYARGFCWLNQTRKMVYELISTATLLLLPQLGSVELCMCVVTSKQRETKAARNRNANKERKAQRGKQQAHSRITGRQYTGSAQAAHRQHTSIAHLLQIRVQRPSEPRLLHSRGQQQQPLTDTYTEY